MIRIGSSKRKHNRQRMIRILARSVADLSSKYIQWSWILKTSFRISPSSLLLLNRSGKNSGESFMGCILKTSFCFSTFPSLLLNQRESLQRGFPGFNIETPVLIFSFPVVNFEPLKENLRWSFLGLESLRECLQ